MNEDCSNSEKIKNVLFNEVTFVVALVTMISGVIFWVTNPQQDMQIELVKLQSQLESNQTIVSELERIKNNDFVELHEKLNQIESRQIEILQALAVTQHALDIDY